MEFFLFEVVMHVGKFFSVSVGRYGFVYMHNEDVGRYRYSEWVLPFVINQTNGRIIHLIMNPIDGNLSKDMPSH